ncbi:UDP-N-acetylmuramoyl-L-alanyl-D-glutamate--2,6-diaminopimelate ligase [Methylophaga sp.]|uniref:UDP-N-acetylmuramoyl-L-alanyl-D-glutamate--2, 6-diaminopimelate ligase n=1 Tax=Methylophaga sp. TaxID=2024840 RepID=UPI003F696F92
MMTSIVKKQSLTLLLEDVVADDVELQEYMLTDISMDSRRITSGALFLALAQNVEQRQKHLHQALDRGAFAVLIDVDIPLSVDEMAMLNESVVSAYPVKNLSQKAGFIASRFYNEPSQRMTVIAVTGTNGKTSVSQFVAQALESVGKPCGVIGTMGAGRLSDLEMTGMTTPDPVSMQRLLAGFELEGCKYVALEASSHALEQGRLNSVDINVAVLTNLSRDHLDYHKTMANYAKAKQRLFEMDSVSHAVINANDNFGKSLLAELNSDVEILTYSSAEEADINASKVNCHRDGMQFELSTRAQSKTIESPVMGRFNVDNLLATFGVLLSIGYQPEDARQALSHCRAVSGRMQAHGVEGQPTVVIDYAHTPDALKQALKTLQSHLSDNGKLWCVFGCGGDRDKGKRALMGQIAETEADEIIITNDNPRTEDHQIIVDDILAGCLQPQNIRVELDRKAAINYAISHAAPRDIVLVAGKGHEAYQEIEHIKYPFSDSTVVSYALGEAQNSIYNVAGGQ